MIDRDLRKLGRTELLELLLERTKENDELRGKVTILEGQLSDRRIMVDEAGSIAESSLKLAGVFGAAQKAANLYLDNIKALSERQESIFAQKEAEANEKINKMISDAENEISKRVIETEEECERRLEECEKREREVDEQIAVKWNEFNEKASKFIAAHDGLKEVLSVLSLQGIKNE